MFGLAPVAFWKTEKAVCAKSRFSFLGLWALAFRFVFGMAQFATRQRQVKFKFQTDPLPRFCTVINRTPAAMPQTKNEIAPLVINIFVLALVGVLQRN